MTTSRASETRLLEQDDCQTIITFLLTLSLACAIGVIGAAVYAVVA